MNLSQRFLIAIGLLAASLNFGAAAEEAKKQNSAAASEIRKLAGVWLAESADMGGASRLADVWTSKLTLTADTFALSRYFELAKDLRGRFRLDPSASPKTIDLQVDELDLSAVFEGVKIPACTVRGIYKLDGDRFIVCFPTDGRQEPPPWIDVKDKRVAVLTFARAAADFRKFPEQVAVTVKDRDGKPAAGATVFGFMFHRESAKAKPGWQFDKPIKTEADGTAKVPYEQLRFAPLAARDEAGKQIGLAAVSPVSLQTGVATIVLKPQCRISGTLVCEKLRKAGKPLGWTNVYLNCGGRRIASYDFTEGKYEFLVPPGTYTLKPYGSDLRGKDIPVTVPEGQSELAIKPIALTASSLLRLLQGGPAPELEGVVAWKGEKVKLADLKGKYVLLEFWGYWCGPCIHSMPVLIELHEKFADKGLAIIGVHLDLNGEVDTAAKYDEKIAPIKRKLWKGKSLPFPVALTSGKLIESKDKEQIRGGAAAQYGILGYPTTILIDRKGNVVGKFQARDAKQAVAEVEKLLSRRD